MNTFILVIVLSISASVKSGSTAVVQEFTSYERCVHAGRALIDQAEKRHNYILTWGCFQK